MYLHKGIFNSVSRATAWWDLRSHTSSTPGIPDYSVVLWDFCSKGLWENMIKAILLFKEVADSEGRAGEGEVAGQNSSPCAEISSTPGEKKKLSLSCLSQSVPLSVSSVYKQLWRLLKGNRSQGVKEFGIANQFALRCQHRSSWDPPRKIMGVGLWGGGLYWNLSYRGVLLHESSTSSGVCMHLCVWNVFGLPGADRTVKQDSYSPVSQQAASAAV